MFEFLATVWGKVQTFFTSLWGRVVWLSNDGYATLQTYVYSLYGTLRDYTLYRYYGVLHYTQNARGKYDTIAYYNYDKTYFSAIDSFWSIVDYRSNRQSAVSDFTNNLYTRLRYWVFYGLNALNLVTSTDLSIIGYALGRGVTVSKNYETSERPGVLHILGLRVPIERLTTPQRATNLVDVADRLHDTLSTLKQQNAPIVLDFVQERQDKFTVFTDVLYERFQEVHDYHWSDIETVFELADVFGMFIRKNTPEKLFYLTETRWQELQALAEHKDMTIYDWLEDSFLAWFFDRLYMYLMDVKD